MLFLYKYENFFWTVTWWAGVMQPTELNYVWQNAPNKCESTWSKGWRSSDQNMPPKIIECWKMLLVIDIEPSVTMNSGVFWNVTPFSLVGASTLHRLLLLPASGYLNYTVSHSTRQQSSLSRLWELQISLCKHGCQTSKTGIYTLVFKLPDLVSPRNMAAITKISLLVIFILSQIGGSTARATMSDTAVIDRKKAVSCFVYPKSWRKKGTIILKFTSAT